MVVLIFVFVLGVFCFVLPLSLVFSVSFVLIIELFFFLLLKGTLSSLLSWVFFLLSCSFLMTGVPADVGSLIPCSFSFRLCMCVKHGGANQVS